MGKVTVRTEAGKQPAPGQPPRGQYIGGLTTTPPPGAPGDDTDDDLLEELLEENAPVVTKEELGEETRSSDPNLAPWLKDISANLLKKIQTQHIQWLPGKMNNTTGKQGEPIPYLAWSTACDYLDHYAPGWDYEIVRQYESSGRCIVHARIIIRHRTGVSSRDALGAVNNAEKGIGTPEERAESKALRRAAAKHGLGRHLYSKTGRPAPPEYMTRGR